MIGCLSNPFTTATFSYIPLLRLLKAVTFCTQNFIGSASWHLYILNRLVWITAQFNPSSDWMFEGTYLCNHGTFYVALPTELLPHTGGEAGLEPATYGLPGCLIDADSAFLSLFCNNYITNLLQSQFFWQPRSDSNWVPRLQRASGFRDRRVNHYTTGQYCLSITKYFAI